MHPYARSRIYDLRKYNEENGWGPFKDAKTGEVDWERVLCIMVDLDYNLRRVKRFSFWSDYEHQGVVSMVEASTQ